jgi:hypothetical protein
LIDVEHARIQIGGYSRTRRGPALVAGRNQDSGLVDERIAE